jgi:hypothetical protein
LAEYRFTAALLVHLPVFRIAMVPIEPWQIKTV